MRLRNILLAVNDMEQSKAFYQKYFSLSVIRDFCENVILTEGLVLQEQKSWERLIEANIITGNASELFFVEDNLDSFLRQIEPYLAESGQTANVRENSWGKRVLMLKDPDGHLIEVAEG